MALMQKILVPIDFSEHSAEAYDLAVAAAAEKLARALDRALGRLDDRRAATEPSTPD